MAHFQNNIQSIANITIIVASSYIRNIASIFPLSCVHSRKMGALLSEKQKMDGSAIYQ